MSFSAANLLGVDPGWDQVLEPVSSELELVLAAVAAERAAGAQVLPAAENVLRVLRMPPASVKVLIIGQDPYPTPGHAIGLAFATAADVRPLPKSLQNIYRELHADTGIAPPEHGDLSAWEAQGVMLLNTALTVRAGEAGSHAGIGWRPIVRQIVRYLAVSQQPLVAILWGKHAQELLPDLGFKVADGVKSGTRTEYLHDTRLNSASQNTAAIASAHPSPLSVYRGFFGSRPFTRANELLQGFGADPINWEIPAA